MKVFLWHHGNVKEITDKNPHKECCGKFYKNISPEDFDLLSSISKLIEIGKNGWTVWELDLGD